MRSLVPVLGGMLLAGCSTMFNSGSQSVEVKPSKEATAVEAEITVPNGRYEATLPTVVSLSPSTFQGFVVQITDPCFKSGVQEVGKSVHASYFFNILNLHGFWIDVLTGAMWDYGDRVFLPVEYADPLPEGCERRARGDGLARAPAKPPTAWGWGRCGLACGKPMSQGPAGLRG